MRANGKLTGSTAYCNRFRLVDLLMHGKVQLNGSSMRGLHTFTDSEALISVHTDALFFEAR